MPAETKSVIMPAPLAIESFSVSFDEETSPMEGMARKISMNDCKIHDKEHTQNSEVSKEHICSSCGQLADRQTLLRKLGAELLATFIVVFAGCGAVMVNELKSGAITHVGIAFVFGVAVMVMIYTIGHVSGGHMNPAVTFALAVVERFPWNQVAAYIGAQIFAAICAAFALQKLLPQVKSIGGTFPPNNDYEKAFIVEAMITFIFMFVASGVATDSRAFSQLGGLSIGSVLIMNGIFAGPISGASMNPARSIGPAVVTANFTSLWVYIVGPILGASLGALFYTAIRLPEPDTAPRALTSPKNYTPKK